MQPIGVAGNRKMRPAAALGIVSQCPKEKPQRLPQEFLFQRIAVSRDGRIADIRVLRKSVLECVKLRVFGLADHKSLIYCHIAVNHCWSLRRECRSDARVVGRGQLPTHLLPLRLLLRKFT
jgi:hypothetical protein